MELLTNKLICCPKGLASRQIAKGEKGKEKGLIYILKTIDLSSICVTSVKDDRSFKQS